MSREQIEEMAEMLEIIENAREVYANDVTDHTENEYIREGLLNAGYRKQSEIVRCKDCEYAYMDGDRVYCRNIQTPWYNDYFEVFTEANDFCSYAKMKGGAE